MRGFGGWFLAGVLLLAGSAHAHELTLAELDLRESAPGQFILQWGPTERRAPSEEITIDWPSQCHAAEGVLQCGTEGLSGAVSMQGVGKSYSAVMLKTYWLDGQDRVYTFTSAQSTVHLYGSADDKRGMGEIARAYTVLGVEHILTGFDHLLFVLALLFLVGFNRRLLYTITAFTLAHSLTLALAALGLLTLRSPPVEASIALSIVLVAGEALHDGRTFARRWPAVVAFLFGLVHGLGFAGALKEIGLPQAHLPVALLTFNVGVELGQLLVVTLAYALYRAVSAWPRVVVARAPALYAIGAVAAYWSIYRVVGLLT
jgi:hydrogenase/urease accessory protein HupE